MLPALLVAAAATVSSATRVPDPLDVSLDVLPVGFCEPSLARSTFCVLSAVPRRLSSVHEPLYQPAMTHVRLPQIGRTNPGLSIKTIYDRVFGLKLAGRTRSCAASGRFTPQALGDSLPT